MIKTKKVIEIYSDGSGNTMNGDGGYGWVMIVDGIKIDEGSGYLKKASNNVAELTAAIRGLDNVELHLSINNILVKDAIITLISDSQLVLNYAKNTWKCKKEHLRPLNKQIQIYYNRLNASGRWVKGHSGNEHNERCDVLAGTARKEGRKARCRSQLVMTLVRLGLVLDKDKLQTMARLI